MKDFLIIAFEYFVFDHGRTEIACRADLSLQWMRSSCMTRPPSKISLCDKCRANEGLAGVKKNAQISVCDTCASDFSPKAALATPVYRILVQNCPFSLKSHRVRRLWSGLRSEISVCDTCASDFGRKGLVFMKKSLFATPVERILVENQSLRHLCIGLWCKRACFHKKVTVCDACASDVGPKSAFATPVHRMLIQK